MNDAGQAPNFVTRMRRRQALLGHRIRHPRRLQRHVLQRPQRPSADPPPANAGEHERDEQTDEQREHEFPMLRVEIREGNADRSEVRVPLVRDVPPVEADASDAVAERRVTGRGPGDRPRHRERQSPRRERAAVRSDEYQGAIGRDHFGAGLIGRRLEREPLVDLRPHHTLERQHQSRELLVQPLETQAPLYEDGRERPGQQHGNDDRAVPSRQSRAQRNRHDASPACPGVLDSM